MKDQLSSPKRVVNIKDLKEFQGIHYTAGKGLRLGSLATLEELMENPTVKKEYPALWEAADGVRSPQIRNFGTVGGDLCQRPRCWYFRSGLGYFPKDENGQEIIPRGENQYHAILGNQGPAYFINPSSLAPALIALEARLRLFGPQGWREVAVEEFFTSPSKEGEREYVLKPNEILGELLVPAANSVQNAAYEVREKEALDWPLAAAAVALRMQGQKVTKARLVLGHVAPVPWLAKEAGSLLEGKTINENLAAEAASTALSSARPLTKNSYKVQLAKVALKRAILKAIQGGA
jgi:xanthine dehydrogenase YagS FAD-binding subunit